MTDATVAQFEFFTGRLRRLSDSLTRSPGRIVRVPECATRFAVPDDCIDIARP
jgi:hypothetical protein